MKNLMERFGKKKLVATGVVAVLILIAGVGAYAVSQSKDTKNNQVINYRNAVSGLRDWTVEVGTKEADFMDGVKWNEKYISKVTVDDSDVNLEKEGEYTIVYTIDPKDEKEKDLTSKHKVDVVSKEKAEETSKNGDEVVTPEGVKNKEETKTPSDKEIKKSSNTAKAGSDNKQQSNSNGSTAKANSSNQGNKSSSNSSSNNKPSGNNKPSQPSKEDKPAHKHNWVQVYKTVHHDEVSHQEEYVIKPAWTETVPKYNTEIHTICNCGVDLTELERQGGSAYDHGKAHLLKRESDQRSEKLIQVQVGTEVIEHPAETGTRKVVDKPAYDEQVPNGWKCSECGETKA